MGKAHHDGPAVARLLVAVGHMLGQRDGNDIPEGEALQRSAHHEFSAIRIPPDWLAFGWVHLIIGLPGREA